MGFRISLIFLLFLSFSARSQSTDTTEVYNQIVQAKTTSAPAEKIKIAEEALIKAEEINYPRGIFLSRKIIGETHLETGNFEEGVRTYFQLIDFLEKNEFYSELYRVYQHLAKYFKKEGLFTKSADYFEKAYNLIAEKKIQKDPFFLLLNLAEVLRIDQNYQESLEFLEIAESIAEKQKNISKQIAVLNAYIDTYYVENQFEKGLEKEEEILLLLEEMGDESLLTRHYNNLGVSYLRNQRIDDAEQAFNRAYEQNRENPVFSSSEELNLLLNLAITNFNQNHFSKATQHFDEAKVLAKNENNYRLYGDILDNQALLHLKAQEPSKAIDYNNQTFAVAKIYQISEVKLSAYRTRSLIHESLLDYDKALDDYKNYLSLKDSIAFEERVKKEKLLQNQLQAEKEEKEIRLLIASNERKENEIAQLQLENQNKDILLQNQQLEAKEALTSAQLREEQLENERRKEQLQAAKVREENQQILLKNKEIEQKRKEQEIELLSKINENQDLELSKAAAERKTLFIGAGLSVLIAILVIIGLFILSRANRKLSESRKEIRLERDKSDQLLLNILPEATAAELKQNGKATPRGYEEISILFADFKGFTKASERLSADVLLSRLDEFFSEFDAIMAKFGLEKIKTIGDAYMCASGIPIEKEDHAQQIVKAGLEMISVAKKINQEQIRIGEKIWELRVGINTGPVIAGVVGHQKFAYDIWGDAVNVAARMEENGIPGKLNISESTYLKVKDQFNCEQRGALEAKNKGAINMYLIDPEKQV